MAFPAEDLTVTEIGLGPLILTHSGMATSPRILDVEIDTGDGYTSIMGTGASGVEQILKMFLESYGSGKIRITADRIVALSTVQGEKSTVLLRQRKSQGAKEWTLSASTAVFNPLNVKSERVGKATVLTIEITPTSTTGGRPWAFNEDVTTS